MRAFISKPFGERSTLKYFPASLKQNHLPRSALLEWPVGHASVEGADFSPHLPRQPSFQRTLWPITVEGDFVFNREVLPGRFAQLQRERITSSKGACILADCILPPKIEYFIPDTGWPLPVLHKAAIQGRRGTKKCGTGHNLN